MYRFGLFHNVLVVMASSIEHIFTKKQFYSPSFDEKKPWFVGNDPQGMESEMFQWKTSSFITQMSTKNSSTSTQYSQYTCEFFRKSLWARTSCPLRRAMLCHCGHVAAAVSNFLLMSIGFAVSLLPDDGPKATVLCLWLQNKVPPSPCNHSDADPLGVWIHWQVPIEGQKGVRSWP